MNNNDLYKMAIEKGEYIEAAKLAIGFGQGKGSRAGAWQWATLASEAAEKDNITLDFGALSWPDWERAERNLAAAEKENQDASLKVYRLSVRENLKGITEYPDTVIIIMAGSEREARKIAHIHGKPGDIWLSPDWTQCELMTRRGVIK